MGGSPVAYLIPEQKRPAELEHGDEKAQQRFAGEEVRQFLARCGVIERDTQSHNNPPTNAVKLKGTRFHDRLHVGELVDEYVGNVIHNRRARRQPDLPNRFAHQNRLVKGGQNFWTREILN